MDKEGSQKTDGGSKHLMDKEAASRIQSAEAKQHGGGVEKGSFASRAQSTADKRENQKNQANVKIRTTRTQKVDREIENTNSRRQKFVIRRRWSNCLAVESSNVFSVVL